MQSTEIILGRRTLSLSPELQRMASLPTAYELGASEMRVWLALAITVLPMVASAADSPHRKLQDALMCKGEPLDALRSLNARNSDGTYTATDFGDGMDYTNVVILKIPIRIAGSTTQAVIGEVRQSHSDFAGHVYSRFKGDYRQVVEQLGLVKSKAPVVGRYEREVETRSQDLECPKTIGLTPKDNGEFLLGCGWCNG